MKLSMSGSAGFTGGISGALILAAVFCGVVPEAKANNSQVPLADSLGKLQVPFQKNQGQVDAQVAFYAQTFAGQVYVTHEGQIVTVVHRQLPSGTKARDGGVAIWEDLGLGSSQGLTGSSPSTVKVSYLATRGEPQRQIDVPAYEWIELGDVGTGIHARVRARGNNVERYFHVAPGADPRDIQVSLQGINALSIADDGQLVLHTALGAVHYSAPVAWQIIDEKRVEVGVEYAISRSNELAYGFHIDQYDENHELIVDPLIAATLLGGSGFDRSVTLATDGASAYVAGHSLSLDFPTTPGAFDMANTGGASGQFFVSRFDSALTTLQASTYFGFGLSASPTNSYRRMGIKTHNGDVYIAYRTEFSQNPVLGNSFDSSLGGISDIFLARLSGDLTTLQGATFLGGSGTESFGGLDIMTTNGNVCVGGSTTSADFPTTTGAHSTTIAGQVDGFVSCLNDGLTGLVASSYIGSFGGDSVSDIVVVGTAVVAGGRTSGPNNFPTPNGAIQVSPGGIDGFVALFGSAMQLVSATLIGGAGTDEVLGVAAHGGSVYAAGTTEDPSGFPSMVGHDPSHNGGRDIYVFRFNGLLSVLDAGTFLGGSMDDRFADLAIDADGTTYVLGNSISTDFPTSIDAFQQDLFGTTQNLVLSTFNANLSGLQYSTYLRGVLLGIEISALPAMAIESPGTVLLPGIRTTEHYIVTANAYQTQPLAPSTVDAIVTRMWLSGQTSEVSVGFTPIDFSEEGGTLNIEVTRTGGTSGLAEVYWQTQDGTAIHGVDYIGGDGRIRWEPNDASPKTIAIPINPNHIDDGDRSFTVSLDSPAGATIAPFGGGRTINILDDDTAGIAVAGPMPSASLREIPDTATVAIQLDSEPELATVTVSVMSTDTTAGTLQGAVGGQVELVFTDQNWQTPQVVTVHSVDDDVDDGDQPFDLSFTPSQSSDPNYSGLTLDPVNLVTVDDDEAGFHFEPMSPPLTTSENGTVDTFMLRLASEPLATVIVEVAPDSDGLSEGSLMPPNLTFTAQAWDSFQTIDVMGLDDPDVDGDIQWQVLLSGISNDPLYAIPSAGGPLVINLDNDAIPVNLSMEVTNGQSQVMPFLPLTYSVEVINLGTAPVNGALVTSSALNLDMANATWTCVPEGLSACAVPSGTGPISALIDVDSKSRVEFVVQTSALNMPFEQAELSAVVTVPAGTTDIDPIDNFSVDSDLIFVSVIFRDGLETPSP